MSYTQPDPVRQTSCKECLFAIYTDQTQTGCKANRIEKFGKDVIEAYDKTKEFYVIDRLCNLFRSQSWNHGESDVIKAKNESALNFDILIDCDKIDTESKDSLVKELLNISYPEKKISIILYHSYTIDKEKRKLILEAFKNLKNITVSVVYEKYDFLQNYIDKSKNLFHIAVDIDKCNNINQLINSLNNEINDELQKCLLFSMNNIYAISNPACKLIYTKFYDNFDHNFNILKNDCINSNLYIEYDNENKKKEQNKNTTGRE